MGVFHVFKIVQMVRKRVKHHIFKSTTGYKTNTAITVSNLTLDIRRKPLLHASTTLQIQQT